MSSSDRRHVLFMLATLLPAGCGFRPAYAPGSSASGLRGRIDTDEPRNPSAFAFVAAFEDRLGRAEMPLYRLSYQITTQRADLAVNTAGSILRYNIVGQVSFTVTDTATGAVLTQGAVDSFTGSAATGATIAAQAADDDARERLMRILADQVATRLVATAAGWAAPA